MKQAYKRTTRNASNGEWFLIVVIIPVVIFVLMISK
jgi:hypothetical protein